MKPSSIKAGDVLYSIERGRVGNTTVRGTSVYPVYIEALDAAGGAFVHWNVRFNPLQHYSRGDLAKLRRTPPEWSGDWINGYHCYFCGRRQAVGHDGECEHPKAVKARKAAAASNGGNS